MASIIKVDQLSEKTQGSGITLSHSLKNSSGSEIISSSGSIGSAVDFANIANDSISGDKIHSGTISSSTLDGIKLKSSGNSITASDGTTPVLSESGGVVTLAHDIIDGSSSYGFAQIKLTGDVGTQGWITFNTVLGDSNFTISNEFITLPYSGIYHIVFSGTGIISANTPERIFTISLYTGATSLLATARDQVSYLDSANSFGNACLSYVGSFTASDTIKFYFVSDSDQSIDLQSSSHASIVLLRRTA